MNKKGAFEFKASTFLIALALISMFAIAFATFAASLQEQAGLSGNLTLDKYNSSSIIDNVEEIRDSTNIDQDQGILDVVGGFFSSGYASLKITAKSYSIFDGLLEDAADDIPALALFKPWFIAIILIALFLGVIITVLVKMRV